MKDRLTLSQISILRSLTQRGGAMRPITLDHARQRSPILPLWRRGIIEIWYRQAPETQPSLQGPYYGLTVSGAQLASNFLPRLGDSGAEQDR